MDIRKVINKQKASRRFRVRRRIRGTAERPRLSVHRTLTSFSCQLIDDMAGKTLAAASTQEKSFKSKVKYGGNCEAAKELGTILAHRASQIGIKAVAFDRGDKRYHGRVAAFAQAAREAGLDF